MKEADKEYWLDWRDKTEYSAESERFTPADRRLALTRRFIIETGIRTVFDVGCGPGRNIGGLVGAGIDRIYLADALPEFLGQAGDAAGQSGIDWQGWLWDIDLTFPGPKLPETQLVTAFSVLPYSRDWTNFFNFCDKVLPSGGHIIATFPNLMFDLYTANTLTADFIYSELIDPAVKSRDVEKHLADLFPVQPEYSDVSAHAANIHFERYNPLTLDGEFANRGYATVSRYFMHYHPLPPVLTGDVDQSRLQQVSDMAERDLNRNNWRDLFICSTFMLILKKE